MIFAVNKPKGFTSFDVVAKLRKSLGIKKVGHAGTLDPMAEGVLVILTGSDTKKQLEFMKSEKEYIAEIAFGIESDTYDITGKIKHTGYRPSRKDIKRLIPKYTGVISQTVPPFSAVKVSGQRLYKLARSGRIDKAKLPVKKVRIFEFQILDFGEKFVDGIAVPVLKCKIVCGSGTYIRSVAHDMGGVLISLTRTRVGDFRLEGNLFAFNHNL